MAPNWTRLIRFKTADSSIHYGEPLGSESDIMSNNIKQAKVIDGGPLGTVTDKVADVVELLGPLAAEDSPAIICIGLNYKKHALEAGVDLDKLPPNPPVFMKFPNSLAGPGNVRIPTFIGNSDPGQLDYEGELAVIIGKGGRNIPEDKALSHVLGYAASNDVSARTLQMTNNFGQWIMGKAYDDFAPIGPVIASTSLIPDPHVLQLTTHVNGEKRQDSSTGDLIHSVNKIISFLSRGNTLEPLTVILTGTPSGVGLATKTWLKDGDVVKVTVEKCGTLENTMCVEKEDKYVC